MTMQQFVKKWGTRSASLLIKESAEYAADEELAIMLGELANELESALKNYVGLDVDVSKAERAAWGRPENA